MASRNARSRRFPRGKSGLASIIVVTYNNPDYTRLTLESVIEKTRYPHYELIVVDNGSEAETRDWLITFAAAHPERVRLILNDRNLGFPAANNAGIRAAHRAEYIVLLNNDCIVTRGWLSGLIRYLRDPEIGMVGPVTNFCGNEACINAEYGRLEDLPRFARRYTSARHGRSFDISMLAMFCVAMRRAVVDKIGPLDEQFGAGMFEDDDYAHRVRQAGYRIVCAEDIYVHHFGRSSFSRLHEDEFTATFAQNRAHFESKWATTWTPPCPRAGVIVEPWDAHVERWQRTPHERASWDERVRQSVKAARASTIALLRPLYHTAIPYSLRIKVWSWRHSAKRRLSGYTSAQSAHAGPEENGNGSAFAAAVTRHFGAVESSDPMFNTWVSYALGTNDRGRKAVGTIERFTTIPGKRHLDIGCAHGGTPIAFAQAGAHATGIEIDPTLLELAHANLADHPGLDCTVMVGDILQPEIAGSLSAFDIITCENVIEHVDVARELVATIRSLLTDGGVAHLAIPNAFAFSEVARDGHYGLFALTLLPRDRSIAYFEASGHTEPYTVGEYYFTFEHYVEMFQEEGLSIELLNPLEPSRADLDALRRDMDSLPGKYEDAVRQDKIPSLVRDEVKARLLDYLSGYEAMRAEYENASGDKRNALARQLLRHYRQDLWYVLARPLPASVPAGGR